LYPIPFLLHKNEDRMPLNPRARRSQTLDKTICAVLANSQFLIPLLTLCHSISKKFFKRTKNVMEATNPPDWRSPTLCMAIFHLVHVQAVIRKTVRITHLSQDRQTAVRFRRGRRLCIVLSYYWLTTDDKHRLSKPNNVYLSNSPKSKSIQLYLIWDICQFVILDYHERVDIMVLGSLLDIVRAATP